MSFPSLQPSFPPSRNHGRSITLQPLRAPTTPRGSSSSQTLRETLKPLILPTVNHGPVLIKSPNTARCTPVGLDLKPKFKGIIKNSLADIDLKAERPMYRGVKFGYPTDTPKTLYQRMKEESSDRLVIVRKYIDSFSERRHENQDDDRYPSRTITEKYKQVIDTVENTLAALDIKIKEIKEIISDSAAKIYPVNVNQDLVNFYTVLMQEVCEFPYSFISKLKIIMITVCNNVSLQNPLYTRIFNQKINNGFFLVRDMQTREAVRNHWYRIVIYHFIKVEPEFYEKWKELFGTGIYKKGDMEELIQVLRCAMRSDQPKQKITQLDEKIEYMKEELIRFDPMVLNEEWSSLKTKKEKTSGSI